MKSKTMNLLASLSSAKSYVSWKKYHVISGFAHIGLAQDTSAGVWTVFSYHDFYLKDETANVDKLAHAVFYELFPLCPSCGKVRWCPAKEERLWNVRDRAARKEKWRRRFGLEE